MLGPGNLGGISRAKVYGLITCGQLHRVNIGRRFFVTGESIQKLIDRVVGE